MRRSEPISEAERARKADVRSALYRLSVRVSQLRPHARDPERFHEEKSEISFDLLQLAERIG